MIVTIIMLAILVMLILTIASMAKGRTKEETDVQAAAWAEAVQTENSIIGRVLLGVSRPLARMPRLYDQLPSRQYQALQSKVFASNSYAGDAEVFIAVQAGAIFLGAVIVIASMLALSGLLAFVCSVIGVGLGVYPYNLLSKRAKQRAVEVSIALPEFAELLQMPLTMGQGIMTSLRFTTDRLDGPVAEEVRNLESLLAAGAADETEAFTLAGERLGTPEARSFFQALLQSQLEGSRVADIITAQAESLRIAVYQRQRTEVKKLPIKMVVMFGIHFMPLLFIVALIPTLYSLSHF
jgi:Flp pilus assembly protein TadB